MRPVKTAFVSEELTKITSLSGETTGFVLQVQLLFISISGLESWDRKLLVKRFSSTACSMFFTYFRLSRVFLYAVMAMRIHVSKLVRASHLCNEIESHVLNINFRCSHHEQKVSYIVEHIVQLFISNQIRLFVYPASWTEWDLNL